MTEEKRQAQALTFRKGGADWASYLSREALIGPVLQQKLDHLQMVLLSRHVERTEAFLWEHKMADT